MKFNNNFDFVYFKKKNEDALKDQVLRKLLNDSDDLTIPDEIFFLLDDSKPGLIAEVKYYSAAKPYFLRLNKPMLDFKDMPALSSLLTHLSLSWSKKIAAREKVDSAAFVELKNQIYGLMDSLVDNILVENTLLKLLFE